MSAQVNSSPTLLVNLGGRTTTADVLKSYSNVNKGWINGQMDGEGNIVIVKGNRSVKCLCYAAPQSLLV